MSDAERVSSREQRCYPRAHVSKALGDLVPELQAQVTWANHEISAVADLSYKGMAVRRPGMFMVSERQRVDIEIALGLKEGFRASAVVAWCNADWVGLEISSLPAEGHSSMRDYLDAKLLGAGLKPVSMNLLNARDDFQIWFQGAGQTHVFIRMAGRSIERVRLDHDGDVLEFVRGQSRPRFDQPERRAFLILSQMDKDGLPMEDFLRSLLSGA